MLNPRPNDAVLGNSQVPSTSDIVLGGIVGAEQRLNSTSLRARLEALCSTLQYNDEGIKLVHQFITQETSASIRWIYTNWVLMGASDAARAKLINSMTCLQHISKELMELVLTAMITDTSRSKLALVQDILQEIDELHNKQAEIQSLAAKYEELGDLYYERFEQGEYKDENLKIAVITYQKAIECDNDSPQVSDILNKRGIAYFYLRDYQAALENVNLAIKINSNRSIYFYYRGLYHHHLSDIEAAIEDYSKAIKINPKNVDYYGYRGLAYSTIENNEAAIQDYNKAITMNPSNSHFYDSRGDCYYELKNGESAIKDYNQAIIINPNNAMLYYKRGLAYHHLLKDIQAAIKDYSNALIINPDYLMPYYQRGDCNYKLKDIQAAIKDYNKCITLYPNDANVYKLRGNCYYNLGDIPSAIEDYRQAAFFYKQQGQETSYEFCVHHIKELEKS